MKKTEKLEAMLRRAQRLESQIAAEKIAQQKQGKKDERRLSEIIGSIVIEKASPDLRLAVMEILDAGVIGRDRRFLQEKEWL
jgi:hypothetical protein